MSGFCSHWLAFIDKPTRELADIDQHKRAALTECLDLMLGSKSYIPKTMRDDLFEESLRSRGGVRQT